MYHEILWPVHWRDGLNHSQHPSKKAITSVAAVSSIELLDDTKKFVVNFAEPARQISPIPLLKHGKMKAPQNLRYTNYERLLQAKSLDDI